ncbi:MAG: hypothetical protein KU37_09090 [Sulfuricurvum sp. PC08-66]|nr:MAG: hypothetical protein KU37_09090 [Sulfuricurvum sp. PC08-66]
MGADLFTTIGFGIIANFLFSFLFGLYLSENIGIDEMIRLTGNTKPPLWQNFIIFIPFAKMVMTLWRVTVLQFWFLNQGKSHRDYWIYLTSRTSY